MSAWSAGPLAAAGRLAELVRFPTVSSIDRSAEDEVAFRALKDRIPLLWPGVAASIPREEVGDRGLLYEWRGGEAALAPAILCAHFDVVSPGELSAWSHPPFSGDIADGSVWGRGTQDIKVLLAAIMEASEALLAEGFRPRRTVLFAFGGDEEISGRRGAGRIAARLAERGLRASFVLDEGSPVSHGVLPFVERPLALVGVTQKGYVDIQLEARGPGGHSSMPPRRSATACLGRAVAALEDRPFPSRLTASASAFLSALLPHMSPAYRRAFRALRLCPPLLKALLLASPTTAALVRTTTATTMLHGSEATNVLPDKATATVNVRMLPGDDSAGVLARVGRVVARYGVKASIPPEASLVEPLPESPVDHEGFRAIAAAVGEAFPGAAAIPFLFIADTDTKHYRNIAEALYRFCALDMDGADIERIHGIDERVSIDNYSRCVAFYSSLLRSL